jgi:hypothetical protein
MPALKPPGIGLIKNLAAWGHKKCVNPVAGLITNMLPTIIKGLREHNTAAPTAIGIIVNLFLFVFRIIADLVAFNPDKPALLPSAQYAFAKYVPDGVGD